MILDYIPGTKLYALKVLRAEGVDLQALMADHGLDLSMTASTAKTAVLFTPDVYAAAAFRDTATDVAKGAMGDILKQIEASWAPSSNRHIATPSDRELWPFQRASVDYALQRKHTLVGDQPGLGKTPIAICYANETQAKRVLVICPANIRDQWVKRIREWTTMRWPYHIHIINNSRHGVHPHAAWTVLSYDLARTPAIARAIAAGLYDVLILDEAHYLKTVDARRTRAVFGGGDHNDLASIASRAANVLALTGTPLPNRPREAYTLARGLCWDAIDYMSEDRFKKRFNPSVTREVETADGWKRYTDERSGRHAELQNRLRAHLMVRHIKREVMPQLKLPIFDVIELDADAAPVKAALAVESLLGIDPEEYEDETIPIDGQVSTARLQMGLAIAPQVIDYIDMLIDGGEEKLLIGAWHTEVIDAFETAWQRHGVLRWKPGASRSNEAKKMQFMNDPRFKIALGNLMTIGTGTDGLQQVCTHALLAEPDWVMGNNIQFFDRLDRGGQTGQVQGDIFVVPGSLAEKILGRGIRKLHTTDKALDRRVK